jgi:hypothetical protein
MAVIMPSTDARFPDQIVLNVSPFLTAMRNLLCWKVYHYVTACAVRSSVVASDGAEARLPHDAREEMK